MRRFDEVDQPLLRFRSLRIETEDDPRRHLKPVAVQCANAFEHRHRGILLFDDAFQPFKFRRLDADEDRDEGGLPH